ncbi:redoxin domain-containing protein [Natronomonas sp. F2-12]|jgi:peroxiredoxin|uniref:Redoxin domain-containing protein n=1 Tax=Natronomonas aquatica TaxID=2841590 RepID=A0A9R1CRS8_9EURY|nr:redoxin domain-containing protein [Natronomonas aquatica]MCQ4332652.1 redoxin domain-containing protein [Natronomonas aquatica]
MIQEGQTAPDFALPGVEDGTPAVYELFRPIGEGEAVLLWFVPTTFLPTATAELRAVGAAGWHDVPGLRVWVLTMDSIYAASAYADRYDLPMAFLGDAGSAAGYYGVEYDEWEGHYGAPKRAVFLVGADWTVGFAWSIEDAFGRPDPSPLERVSGTIEARFPAAEPPPTVTYGQES